MKKLLQSTLKRLITFALIIFVLWSCKDDKVDKKQSFVLTIDATALASVTSPFYLIISDQSGNTVTYEEVKLGQKYDLTITGEFDDNLFTLTELDITKGSTNSINSNYARTYMGLPTQNMTWTPTIIGISHFSTYSFTNFPSGNVTVCSNSSLPSILSASNPNAFLAIANSTSYLMTSSGSGTQIKYKLFTNDNAGYDYTKTNSINLALMAAMPVKSVTLPSGLTSVSISVKGILKSGPGAGSYYLPNTGSALLTPDLSTLFDDYLFFAQFTKGNYTYFNRTYTNLDVIPITNTITAKSKTNQSITYTTSGAYDYDRIYASYKTATDGGAWYVYAPRSDKEQSIMIPTIPQDIISKYAFTNPSLYQIQYFTATDIKSISSYQDFFTHRDWDSDATIEEKTSQILPANF